MINYLRDAGPKTKAQLQTGDYVSGVRHSVVLKGRDDLFDPTTGDEIVTDSGEVLPGLQVFVNNEVTAIPDNVGCCEVVSVGSDVQNVKPGDVAFIDFYDVRQGCLLGDPETQKGKELYIANDDAFKALFDAETGEVRPLPGYLITKRTNDRMKVALTGTDRVELPPNLLTRGIVGGRTSEGDAATFVIYEEVVSVGAPESEGTERKLARAERAVLDMLAKSKAWCEYDQVSDEEAELINDYLRWRNTPRQLDVKPGDLVPFCTDLAVQIRVRGEFMRIVPQAAVLGVIDDRAILEDAIKAGKAGKLHLAEGAA